MYLEQLNYYIHTYIKFLGEDLIHYAGPAEHKGTVGICSNHHLAQSESIEQLALNEVCVTVHLLLTAARRTPAVRASRRTVRASWLVSQ